MRNKIEDVASQQVSTVKTGNGDYSLDVRIFNLICLVIAFTGVSSGVLNIIVSNPAIEMAYSVVAIVVGLLCWYLSVKHDLSRLLRTPLVLFFLVVLGSAWLTNQGYDGSTPYFLFLLCNATIIIAPAAQRWTIFVIVLLSIVVLYIVTSLNPSLVKDYISPFTRYLDIALSFFSCLLITTLLTWLVVREYEKEKQKNEQLIQQSTQDKARLEQLLSELTVLKGILPVCSFCKKIRDEDDTWQSMEHYISSRSQAQFSHGFCPDCAKEHYQL